MVDTELIINTDSSDNFLGRFQLKGFYLLGFRFSVKEEVTINLDSIYYETVLYDYSSITSDVLVDRVAQVLHHEYLHKAISDCTFFESKNKLGEEIIVRQLTGEGIDDLSLLSYRGVVPATPFFSFRYLVSSLVFLLFWLVVGMYIYFLITAW